MSQHSIKPQNQTLKGDQIYTLLSHAKGRQNFEAAESKGASQSQHNEETKPFYPPQSQIGLQEQAICSKSLKI